MTAANLLSERQMAIPAICSRMDVSSCTVWRWMRHGVVIDGGGKLRLEFYRVGGRTWTTEEALVRFIAAQTPELCTHDDERPIMRSPAKRRAASSRAARELDDMGA